MENVLEEIRSSAFKNHFSSNSHDFRYNLVKYTRLSDEELKELREKHATSFWDLNWPANN